MIDVAFYSLNSDSDPVDKACSHLAAGFYQDALRIFIHSASKEQAEAVDELLWRVEPERFLAHRLFDEMSGQVCPIIIGSGQTPTHKADVLINLDVDNNAVPHYYKRFRSIVEFVPDAPSLKTIAREKFKAYRNLGCEMRHENYR